MGETETIGARTTGQSLTDRWRKNQMSLWVEHKLMSDDINAAIAEAEKNAVAALTTAAQPVLDALDSMRRMKSVAGRLAWYKRMRPKREALRAALDGEGQTLQDALREELDEVRAALDAESETDERSTPPQEPAPDDHEAQWWNAYSDCCAQFGDTRRALNHVIAAVRTETEDRVRREEREAQDDHHAAWIGHARAVFKGYKQANDAIDFLAELQSVAIRAREDGGRGDE